MRNSLKIKAKKVTVELAASDIVSTEVTVTISAPSDQTLLTIIKEASALLAWRQSREPKDMS